MNKERRIFRVIFMFFAAGCIGFQKHGNDLRSALSSSGIGGERSGRSLRIHEYRDENNNLVIIYDQPSRVLTTDTKFEEDKCIISGKEFNYRYAPIFSGNSIQEQEQQRNQQQKDFDDDKYSLIVVGVLSSPENFHAREWVRSTWGQDLQHRVYFIVGGDWEDIEQEFYNYGDIVWIDMKEEWWFLTYKVQMFFQAVENHYGYSYEYILKTDDDSYVGLDVMNIIVNTRQPDYYGFCGVSPVIRDPESKYYVPLEIFPHPFYPNYAEGMGYVISKQFNQCSKKLMPTMEYMPMEDVAIGLLAEECNVACVNDPSIKHSSQFPIHIVHKIDSYEKMSAIHRKQQNLMLMFQYMSERAQKRLIWPKKQRLQTNPV